MLLIDSVLTSPFRGLLFVLREVAKVVEDEKAGDERAVMSDLATLHRSLDAGELTEAAFDVREATLLARLDRLRGQDSGDDAGPHGP